MFRCTRNESVESSYDVTAGGRLFWLDQMGGRWVAHERRADGKGFVGTTPLVSATTKKAALAAIKEEVARCQEQS